MSEDDNAKRYRGSVESTSFDTVCFEFNKWSSSPATGHGMLLRHKADSGPQVGTVSLSLSQQHDVMVSDNLCGQIRSGWQSLLPAKMEYLLNIIISPFLSLPLP